MEKQKLINEAMKITGFKNLINLKKQEEIKQFKGKLKWEGNLEEMRLD